MRSPLTFTNFKPFFSEAPADSANELGVCVCVWCAVWGNGRERGCFLAGARIVTVLDSAYTRHQGGLYRTFWVSGVRHVTIDGRAVGQWGREARGAREGA